MNREPNLEIRWANCGQVQEKDWSVAWAQLIGVYHPRLSEDSVAHFMAELPMHGTALSLAVADGVGGGARGDLASKVLADHCTSAPSTLLGDAQGLARWLHMAEGQVQLKLREVSFSPGAATLAAAWLLPDGSCHFIRVGDARVYSFDGAIADSIDCLPPAMALTTDQTYAYFNEEPPDGGRPDDPARMVGTGDMGEPEIQSLHMPKGRTLLLCSDGLHRGLNSAQIGEILGAHSDLGEATRQLTIAARAHGSTDDISVLLVHRKAGVVRPRSVAWLPEFGQRWISAKS